MSTARHRGPRPWNGVVAASVLPGAEAFAEAFARAQEQAFPGGRVLNVRPDPVDFRDRFYEPPLVEIRAVLYPAAPEPAEVRDQADEGSCTGQALAAVIDIQNRKRREGVPAGAAVHVPQRVSARMLYEMARAYDELPDDRLPGSTVRGAIKGFFHNGVCADDLAPYFPGEPGWQLEVEMARDARATGLGAYLRLRHVLYDYHAALNEVGAIVVSAMIHDGWRRDRVARAEGHIVRAPGDELRGGHAFAIVGYDGDGFFVLNSWGARWGGVQARPGIAHWDYDDWKAHVLDAWVVRLTAPSPRTFHLVGGYQADGHDLFKAAVSTPRIEVNGHYVHLAGGAFVRTGTYPNTAATFARTAAFLGQPRTAEGASDGPDGAPAREGNGAAATAASGGQTSHGNGAAAAGANEAAPPYPHLLIAFESGLEPFEAMIRRAAILTPLLKQQSVYPLFVSWHHGLLARVADILEGQAGRIRERVGDNDTLADSMLEDFARLCVRPLWDELASDAALAVNQPPRSARVPGRRGGAWDALEPILDAASAAAGRIRVHLVAHGAGSIVLGHFVQRLAAAGYLPVRGRRTGDKPPLAAALGCVSLLAPTIPASLFQKQFAPLRAALGRGRKVEVYALPDDWERADRVGAYRKSFLRLVAGAFAGTDDLLGLEATARELHRTRQIRCNLAERSGKRSASRTHVGFLHDAATLNHLLARIKAHPPTAGEQAAAEEAPPMPAPAPEGFVAAMFTGAAERAPPPA